MFKASDMNRCVENAWNGIRNDILKSIDTATSDMLKEITKYDADLTELQAARHLMIATIMGDVSFRVQFAD